MPTADDAAQAAAATRIAAMHRGKVARAQTKQQHEAAIKLQAIQRGKVSRRRFNLAEAVHAPKPKKPAEEPEVDLAFQDGGLHNGVHWRKKPLM